MKLKKERQKVKRKKKKRKSSSTNQKFENAKKKTKTQNLNCKLPSPESTSANNTIEIMQQQNQELMEQTILIRSLRAKLGIKNNTISSLQKELEKEKNKHAKSLDKIRKLQAN